MKQTEEQKKENKKISDAKYREKNKDKLKEYFINHYQVNQEQKKASTRLRKSYIKDCANAMLQLKLISDPDIWHRYCNLKKKDSKKYPYSDDFTDEILFEKMKDGCVYCGDIATSMDRLDSTITHTPDNCVGCCWPCNQSKGNSDPDTFLRKAYYRACGEYFDNIIDIWSDNTKGTHFRMAKRNSRLKNKAFTLTQHDWDVLVTGDCVYCKRQCPEGKCNGVDKIIPESGYTIENTVSCCHDCNFDKGGFAVEDMKKRNERIARRLKNGKITLFGFDTSLLTRGTVAKKVCAYGKVYSSHGRASQAIGKADKYVSNCLHNLWHPDNIFSISDDFYEFAIKTKLENITKKMYILFYRM